MGTDPGPLLKEGTHPKGLRLCRSYGNLTEFLKQEFNLTSVLCPGYVFCWAVRALKSHFGAIIRVYAKRAAKCLEDRRVVLDHLPSAVTKDPEAGWQATGFGGGAGALPELAGTDTRISRVTALMHRAMHRKLLLEELAGASGLSVSRLCHLFKTHVGTGPGQYLKSLRLRRAKELLETSVLSVKEIAVRLGYHDPSRFIEDFRKTYGLPPLRYRERASQTNACGSKIGT